VDAAEGSPQQVGRLIFSFDLRKAHERDARAYTKESKCQIQNGDTPKHALEAGALMTRSKAMHSLNVQTAMSARCRIAPAPSAATTRAAKF